MPKKVDRTKICPVKNCEFKHAGRPCLFFFQYKDGSVSCPNLKRYELAATARKIHRMAKGAKP